MDSVRAIKYFNLFQEYEYRDTAKAREYSDVALKYAYRSGSNDLKGRAHQFKGWYYEDCSRFKEANQQYYKALVYLKKAGNRQGIADAYGNLGNSYLDLNDFQKSLDYQHLSLRENKKILGGKITKEEREWANIGKTYALHNIAALFQEIGWYEKALEYEYESIVYELESKNMEGVAISYNTLATLHKSLNNQDSAIFYFKKALDIYNRYDYPYSKASTLHDFAMMESTGLQDAQRDAMLRESLKIRRATGDVHGELQLLLDIGTLRFQKLKTDSLSNLLSYVYRSMNSYDLEFLEQDYFELYSRYNSRLGKYDSAYFALSNFLELKALSDEKRRTIELIAQDVRFQWETKNFNDSLQLTNNFAVERLKSQEELNRQQNIIYLSVIGLIIVLVSLFFIVQSNFRRKRTNDLLSEKNIEIQQQKEIVESRNKEISDSISYARRLQTAILPRLEDVKEVLSDSFVLFKPKDVVSGDFYWFERLEKTFLIAAADCTGHGVPGAMVSVVCGNALNRAVNEMGITAPAAILNETRNLVIERFQKSDENVVDGMDIALCSLNLETRKMRFAGANNPVWIIRQNDRIDKSQHSVVTEGSSASLLEVKGDKQPVGHYARMLPFEEHEIDLFPGDCIYLSTDGFADQFGGPKGKKFKYAEFREELLKIHAYSFDDQKKMLETRFKEWKGNLEQVDDLCVIGFRIP
jgi:serine phosphatase RsbU (regulator of sigma subunit)